MEFNNSPCFMKPNQLACITSTYCRWSGLLSWLIDHHRVYLTGWQHVAKPLFARAGIGSRTVHAAVSCRRFTLSGSVNTPAQPADGKPGYRIDAGRKDSSTSDPFVRL